MERGRRGVEVAKNGWMGWNRGGGIGSGMKGVDEGWGEWNRSAGSEREVNLVEDK